MLRDDANSTPTESSVPTRSTRSVELAAAMSAGMVLVAVAAMLVGGDVRVLERGLAAAVVVVVALVAELDVLVLLDVDVLLDVLVLLLVLVVVGHKPSPSVQSVAPLQAFPNRSVATCTS